MKMSSLPKWAQARIERAEREAKRLQEQSLVGWTKEPPADGSLCLRQFDHVEARYLYKAIDPGVDVVGHDVMVGTPSRNPFDPEKMMRVYSEKGVLEVRPGATNVVYVKTAKRE